MAAQLSDLHKFWKHHSNDCRASIFELAWGLANSNYNFLWITRPDLIMGESAILPSEFLVETKERGYIASWCPQEEVLKHPSTAGFITHCGWNSVSESISSGIPCKKIRNLVYEFRTQKIKINRNRLRTCL